MKAKLKCKKREERDFHPRLPQSPAKLGPGPLVLVLTPPNASAPQRCRQGCHEPRGPPASPLRYQAPSSCSAHAPFWFSMLPVSPVSSSSLRVSAHSSDIPTGPTLPSVLTCFQAQLPSVHYTPPPCRWPRCLFKDILWVASFCPWLAFCHPPRIVLGTEGQVSWPFHPVGCAERRHGQMGPSRGRTVFVDGSRKSLYISNDLLCPHFQGSVLILGEHRKIPPPRRAVKSPQGCT